MVAMTAVGFGYLMQFFSPPSPMMPAEELLERIRQNHLAYLLGCALVTFFWSLWATWTAPFVIYIRRMERAPLLTYASLITLGGGLGIIISVAVAYTVAGFRAEEALVVQTFTDYGFFTFLYTWPPFAIWTWIIAIAIFRDINPEPLFPRWVAYYNLWCGLLFVPASLVGLLKTGPFAYNGFLAFWVVAIDFFVWMLVMSVVMFQVLAKDEKRGMRALVR